MNKFVVKTLFFAIPSLFMSSEAFAQHLIKGRIVDATTQEGLIGATAIIEGTTIGAATDFDGNFEINSPEPGVYKLIFRSIGYNEVNQSVTVQGETTSVGEIVLSESAIGLEDVMVTASVVRADRQTPVAISNIKLDVLEEKMGNQEFPEVLKSTPSMYATKSGGGYGDSRINMRGFDSNNIGVLVNGVPINDMENGKVYWSNWAGLSDVTQFMQVQRGLGASKLALSSVGGTINILTKTTEAKKGGVVSVGLGNDGQSKYSLALSTGLMDNGWSFSMLASRNTGNGYIQGTNYEGYTYFANITKVINDAHRLAFTAFGAPQWHNQRGIMHTEADWATKAGGKKHNSTMGYYNGEVHGGPYGHNTYHKPQISLNHSWNINDESSLSTALYASIATGGGRRARGYDTGRLGFNSNTGRPFASTMLTPEGYLDIDGVYAQNQATSPDSALVFTKGVNSHQWYGILSTYTNNLTDQITLTAGYDGRYYQGQHYEEVTDLLGASGYVEKYPLYGREKGTVIGVGDKTNFYNMGEIVQQGLFGQVEFANDDISAFLSSSITYQGYRYHAYDKAPIDGKTVSEFQHFVPWSTKAGFSWKINKNHNVFVNGGYFTRAPYFNNVFKNYSILTHDETPYERIATLEAGYTVNYEKFSATVNGYYTQWMDRGRTVSTTVNGATGTGVLRGLDQRHVGVELEATYRPIKNLELKGMFSLGDWTYVDNVDMELFDENQSYVGNYTAYVEDLHVGNAAQMTGALSASYEILPGLKVGADWNYFGKNFADFDINNRREEGALGDSWEMPSYSTLDLSASYRLKTKGNFGVSFFANGYNILNTDYIADAKEANVDGEQTALVYYGFGTTWSAGMKVTF